MATASADRAGQLIDEASSFGRFRLSFDNASSNAMNQNQHQNQLSTTPIDMAQLQRPPSGQQIDQTASVAPSRILPQDHNQTNSNSPALGALELVELTSNPIAEGVLGPNKDGRVRNPVPSKLKGKTDNKQGNFGVMHMGMSPGKKSEAQGRDAAAERDAAARRTSENTASRAKAAQSEKYVPPKKRGMEPTMSAHLAEPQTGHRGSPFAVSRAGPSRPLAPDETKYEQARLLTLLRSINPVTVVDQICKAVAYFGGIPGAPPPEDGIFPESANTRETGALFIGWLAEIFPDLSPRSPELIKEAPTGGKKKGRPSTKSNKAAPAMPVGDGGMNEPPNSRNGYGYGPAVSAPAWGLPQSLGLVNTAVPPPILPGALPPGVDQSKQLQQQSPNTPAKQQLEEHGDNAMSGSKRRRGRPKGSTNKKKADGQPEATSNGQPEGDVQEQILPDSPEVQVNVAKVAQMNSTPSTGFTPVQNNPAPAVKPAQTMQYPNSSWQVNALPNQVGQPSTSTDEFSPEERAVLEAFRNDNANGMNFMPSPAIPNKAGQEAGQKRKRAPPKPKPNPTSAPAQVFPTASPQVTQNTLTLPTSNNESSMGMAKDALQWTSVDNPPPILPPAKKPRQRKPKVAAATEPPSRTQTASVVSSATPPIPPSTIPDSQATNSQPSMQQSIPVARPSEGLEAHYERFTSTIGQQNGRSHTPTIPQQQPQQIPQTQKVQQVQQQATSHVRQPSKPSPSPLHQTIPQTQQTQQMQRQKSQSQQNNLQNNNLQNSNLQNNNLQNSLQPNLQNNTLQNNSLQRDDQKLAQTNSVRPTSTGYYNQRSQTSTNNYAQQYPSHQQTQLYANHQASPQISNNSYRSNSTHTLAQASPQFTQAESTYRTASPHSIAQPSPSFSQPAPSFTQPDASSRTANAYGLAQPSPSFTQAESSYRTPSTHTMTQSTPSYTTSRSHAQTQQTSHQNPYGHFSDPSFIDLPTLDSLGHTGTSNASGVGLNAGYGQGLNLSNSRSTGSNSNANLYGSSTGLSNAFDTGSSDLLRNISRTTSHSNSVYGTTSGMNTFDPGASEYDMRDRMMRGSGRR